MTTYKPEDYPHTPLAARVLLRNESRSKSYEVLAWRRRGCDSYLVEIRYGPNTHHGDEALLRQQQVAGIYLTETQAQERFADLISGKTEHEEPYAVESVHLEDEAPPEYWLGTQYQARFRQPVTGNFSRAPVSILAIPIQPTDDLSRRNEHYRAPVASRFTNEAEAEASRFALDAPRNKWRNMSKVRAEKITAEIGSGRAFGPLQYSIEQALQMKPAGTGLPCDPRNPPDYSYGVQELGFFDDLFQIHAWKINIKGRAFILELATFVDDSNSNCLTELRHGPWPRVDRAVVLMMGRNRNQDDILQVVEQKVRSYYGRDMEALGEISINDLPFIHGEQFKYARPLSRECYDPAHWRADKVRIMEEAAVREVAKARYYANMVDSERRRQEEAFDAESMDRDKAAVRKLIARGLPEEYVREIMLDVDAGLPPELRDVLTKEEDLE